jgi:hypothetical protein
MATAHLCEKESIQELGENFSRNVVIHQRGAFEHIIGYSTPFSHHPTTARGRLQQTNLPRNPHQNHQWNQSRIPVRPNNQHQNQVFMRFAPIIYLYLALNDRGGSKRMPLNGYTFLGKMTERKPKSIEIRSNPVR